MYTLSKFNIKHGALFINLRYAPTNRVLRQGAYYIYIAL